LKKNACPCYKQCNQTQDKGVARMKRMSSWKKKIKTFVVQDKMNNRMNKVNVGFCFCIQCL